jgi:hypothetical protein
VWVRLWESIPIITICSSAQIIAVRKRPSEAGTPLSSTRQAPIKPVGAELVIHGGDLRHRWTVTIGHDRLSWRYDCCI